MIQDRYLLIAFYSDKPKDDEHSRRKYIPKFEYDMISQDATSTVELDDVDYTITNRYSFDLNSSLTGIVNFLIIDVKRNGKQNTIPQSEAAS